MDFLQTATAAAEAGAAALRDVRDNPREISSKGFRDLVSDADYAAQHAVLDVIRTAYPDHLILSEESDAAKDLGNWQVPDGYWWIIDPLDGTTNFLRGVPSYCCSVALAHGHDLIAGAIADPTRHQTFAAGRGQGMSVNGRPTRTSATSEMHDAFIGNDWPRGVALRQEVVSVIGALASMCRTQRSFGTSALGLAYVAAGWLDVYMHFDLKPWDCAAGVLMVAEAGGLLSTPQGEAYSFMQPKLVVTNGHLQAGIISAIRDALRA